jgi:hypothetical protein
MNIITNLCIGITFLFSIILIIDELFNIGYFTYNYTYNYNYGSSTSKFNNQQTIEYETNRFNVYNNITFLFKDIYNKSYFNYLLTIVATLITILCSIAYGVYFYYKFIIEQPEVCTYEDNDDLSLPKQLLKCLCDECHKLIPNCTTNYFIVFIIIIIIPLTYIFKLMFNINFTPDTDNILFKFIYICLFILLIFYYSFNLFSRKSETKYNDLIIYSLFTIIFISSGYIYKYIINKYNNINLNTSTNISTFYDIYKQAPPLKPRPIEKPRYKGIDLLSNFKYNDKDGDADYKIKKTIVDDYYNSIKNYDIDMKFYNQRYNTYTSSLISTQLGDKTNFLDIAINILGLNNYMHIYIIVLLIISLISYSIFKDDISYICFIYLLVLLISLTIMNSILYYNTYVNKYIIYEPLAHYKADITNANTALNIELNPNSGIGFYKKLTNNDITLDQETNSDVKTGIQILEDIKKLVDIKNYTSNLTSTINNDITKYNTYFKFSSLSTTIDKTIPNTIFLYTQAAGKENVNSIEYLLTNAVASINIAYDKKIKIEKYKELIFKFSGKNIIITLNMTGYYRYYYYIGKQLEYLLNHKLETLRNIPDASKIQTLKDRISNLLYLLDEYKDNNNDTDLTTIMAPLLINFKISSTNITSLETFIKDNFEKYCTLQINISILNKSFTANSRIPIIASLEDEIDISARRYMKIRVLQASFLTVAAAITKLILVLEPNEKQSDIEAEEANVATVSRDYNYNNVDYKYKIKNYVKGDLVYNTTYYELPNLITNDNGDEFILNLNTSLSGYFPTVNVRNSIITSDNKNIFNVNSKYKQQDNNLTIGNPANNICAISGFSNSYTIPIILNRKSSTSDLNTKFKKIILAVVFNSICNIQSKFASGKLFNSIRRYKGPTAPSFNSNETYIMKYYDKFIEAFITETIKNSNLNESTDYISFYILLFNAFHSTFIDIKKTVNTNINYLINNSLKLKQENQEILTILSDIIDNELFSDENINAAANDSYKEDGIEKIYKQNKYIIDLIIALLENLLIAIKTEISKDTKYNKLCFPSSTSILTIEEAMNNVFNDPSAITNSPGIAANSNNPATDSTISKTLTSSDAATTALITKLNDYLKYYFNIVIFLLDNIKLNTNTAEIDTITTNFNFYNQDDIVKNTIQKQLIINCDYYNKYNNLDSKQLSYFKINADNVNYNFPILMVIFLIVLGEPIFIKS